MKEDKQHTQMYMLHDLCLDTWSDESPQRKCCVKSLRTETCWIYFFLIVDMLLYRRISIASALQQLLRWREVDNFNANWWGLSKAWLSMTLPYLGSGRFWNNWRRPQLLENHLEALAHFLSCETNMFLMHTPYVPMWDNGFGEWPVMSKLRIARITFAQGGGTSRRNARQVDPNIIPLADHSPLCWHGLPKHRFRAEMQWNLFFREMHRCHGRALHALKDINQCRRIPVLCGPGQHPQLFYMSNELKPSIPLKFV